MIDEVRPLGLYPGFPRTLDDMPTEIPEDAPPGIRRAFERIQELRRLEKEDAD